MKKLGIRNFTLIWGAIESTGSYNPKDIFCWFEESLYTDEYDTIYDFLQWVVDGGTETIHGIETPLRGFGSGNYEQRFNEFLKQR